MSALSCHLLAYRMILKTNSKQDRRRHRRQLLNTSVHVFAGSAQMDALGINMSDVGMCLFTIANLSLGSQIQIEFLSPRSKELVRVAGTVRHRALYLYGIEFQTDSSNSSNSWAGTIRTGDHQLTGSELETDQSQS
jgi:hypothetical protein